MVVTCLCRCSFCLCLTSQPGQQVSADSASRTTRFTFESEQRWPAWAALLKSLWVHAHVTKGRSSVSSGTLVLGHAGVALRMKELALVRSSRAPCFAGERTPFISLTHMMLIKHALTAKQSQPPHIQDAQARILTFPRKRSASALLSLSFGNNLELSPLTLAEPRYPRALSGQR